MRAPYAVRRHRGWYLRLRVPPDLAPALGTHVVRTLSTTCPREARARAAARAAAAPAWWGVLRTEAMEVLGKPLEELALEDLTRANLPRLAADLERMDDAGKRRLRERLEGILEAADDRRRAEQADLDHVRHQVDLFRRGREQGLREALDRLGRAVPAGAAAAPAPAPVPRLSADPRPGLPLSALADAYFTDRGIGESARVSNLKAFQDFEAVTGKKGVAAVSAADVAAFKAWLLAQPGRAGREGAATGTVVKKLNHVRAALAWAADEAGILPETPGAKVKPPREARAAKGQPKRLPFDGQALARIFSSPLYTGAAGPARLTVAGPYRAPAARRFFFLCMLLTGARTEELPGAALHDLDGLPCLDLRDTSTKSAAGRRLVPILPELRKAGFLAWARAHLAGGGTLFRGEGCPADWSQWTGRYLDGIGVSDALHTPYSLRHNFRSMLRGGNLNRDVANRIFGHEEGTAGEEYGRVPLEPDEARAFLGCVKAPVDLSHLYVAR